MLRPYTTIIKDSFHEAFASRVLWILLAVSTLLLLSLVPLGLQERRATQLRLSSVRDWPSLIAEIKRQSEDGSASPGKQLWAVSSARFKQTINEAVQQDPPQVSRSIVSTLLDELNELLRRPDFYDESSWAAVSLDPQVSELLQADPTRMPLIELTFRNRLLLKAAFSSEIAGTPDEELHISYFGWTMGGPLPLNRQMAQPVIERMLANVMDFFVGTVAVFVAILVTAPMIPHTFEAGAIDLLLSKPVSRPLLFLVKFLGGCVFILLNAGLFVVGLWLILGLRFELWNNALLLCIPLFLFLFVIYYSVSASAGVVWKNATVAIVVTILFWATCFTVGTAKHTIEDLFLERERIVALVPTGETILAAKQSGSFVEWRATQWETVLEADRGGPAVPSAASVRAPIYDPEERQLRYIQPRPRAARFRFGGPATSLVTATWSDGSWRQETAPLPPSGASWLLHSPRSGTIVAAVSGLFRLDQERQHPQLPNIGGSSPYVSVGPEQPLRLAETFAAAVHPKSGDLAIASANTLTYLSLSEEGRYHRRAERQVESLASPVALSLAGDSVVVAQSDGQIFVLESDDLKTRHVLQQPGGGAADRAVGSVAGDWFAVLFHNGALALIDPRRGKETVLRARDVSAVAFDDHGQLLVVDRSGRLTSYGLDPLKIIQQRDPPADLLRTTYRYVIQPFYTVLPKPGDLGDVVQVLLAGDEEAPPGPQFGADSRQPGDEIDVRGPIWSSLAFVGVVLGITCLYVARIDI